MLGGRSADVATVNVKFLNGEAPNKSETFNVIFGVQQMNHIELKAILQRIEVHSTIASALFQEELFTPTRGNQRIGHLSTNRNRDVHQPSENTDICYNFFRALKYRES